MSLLSFNYRRALRIWLATLVAGFPASLTCLLLAIGLMGRENNPLIQTFVEYGMPGLLILAPLILIPFVMSGVLHKENWMIVCSMTGVVVVTTLIIAGWYASPTEFASFQHDFGEGISGNLMGAFAQASVAVPTNTVYCLTFWLAMTVLEKRFPAPQTASGRATFDKP